MKWGDLHLDADVPFVLVRDYAKREGWSQLPDSDCVPDSATRRIPGFPLRIKNNLA
jgi:hypothetical protein